MNIKMVTIVRKDLHMRVGKIAAQCQHAVLKVFFDRMEAQSSEYTQTQMFRCKFTPAMLSWLDWKEGEPGFTKIVVGCEGEAELKSIEEKAKAAGIPCAIILDNGVTEFGGVKTYTCIALGPDEVEKIDAITGGYKLL
jgi:PTH2 family peptidyl-tRNA hydrolase